MYMTNQTIDIRRQACSFCSDRSEYHHKTCPPMIEDMILRKSLTNNLTKVLSILYWNKRPLNTEIGN